MHKYAEVAVGLPLFSTFHYRIPKKLQGRAAIGKRVWIPFGHRRILGYLVGFVDSPEVKTVKSLLQIVDETPIVHPDLLQLTR